MATNEVTQKEATELLNRAKAAQARRRAIVDVGAEAKITLPLRETLRLHAPECFGDNATHHGYWGHAKDMDKLLDRGYEPIIVKGQQVTHEGMLAFRLPSDLYRQTMKIRKARSDNMLGEAKAVSKEVQEANKTARQAGTSLADEDFKLTTVTEPAGPTATTGDGG